MTVVAFRLPYPPGSFDVERTFGLHRLGPGDASAAFEQRVDDRKGTARRFRKSFVRPGSADALTHLRLTRADDHVEIVIVFAGPPIAGAKPPRDVTVEVLREQFAAHFEAGNAATGGWLDRLPFDDGYASFAAPDAVMAKLFEAYPGGRILPWPWLFDAAVSVILQQRVSFPEARRSYCALVEQVGLHDAWGRALPDPGRLAALPSWQWTALGVDRPRASAICALAQEELARPLLRARTPSSELRRRLLALPGIGPWTTELLLGVSGGDPDAFLTGDLHLPHIAAWAFARKGRGTEEDLAVWLARYPGQRFRAAGLLLAGKAKHHPVFAGMR